MNNFFHWVFAVLIYIPWCFVMFLFKLSQYKEGITWWHFSIYAPYEFLNFSKDSKNELDPHDKIYADIIFKVFGIKPNSEKEIFNFYENMSGMLEDGKITEEQLVSFQNEIGRIYQDETMTNIPFKKYPGGDTYPQDNEGVVEFYKK